MSAPLMAAALTGCASVSPDWGRSDVAALASERGRELPSAGSARSFIADALEAPLSVEQAVQLALINNPNLSAATAELGFAAAEVYDAGRLANPVLSATRLSPGGGNGPDAQLTLGIAYNFASLLFLPVNKRFAEAQFEAARLSVASQAMELAAEVEAAWFEALAARQLEQMRLVAAEAQRASSDLAGRFFEAGNINRRELALEKAAASESELALLEAKAEAFSARSRLNRLMGLAAQENTWTFAASLPEPLAEELTLDELLRLSVESRLDVLSLRRRAQAIADRYGIVRRTRLINEIEIGVERERDFDGTLNSGPTLALELPIFNWGGGRKAAIQAELQKAEAFLDEKVLEASNQIQLAFERVHTYREMANEFRTALIPNREAVVARSQEEQNFMLIGVFELIQAKQQEYAAYAGYIEAVREYWVARSALALAVGRALPAGPSSESDGASLESQAVSPDAGGHLNHSLHGAH
tara:strand:- start:24077 stop:25495 length:1419 start_codon:yes stop_codon:yes gene_type:complete